MSQRTETEYKAKSLGKVAQDIKAQDSGDMVNSVVVSRKIMILIRGDLFGMRSHQVKAFRLVTFRMTGQKSAEAIVGVEKRAQRTWEDSLHRRAEHRKGKESL